MNAERDRVCGIDGSADPSDERQHAFARLTNEGFGVSGQPVEAFRAFSNGRLSNPTTEVIKADLWLREATQLGLEWVRHQVRLIRGLYKCPQDPAPFLIGLGIIGVLSESAVAAEADVAMLREVSPALSKLIEVYRRGLGFSGTQAAVAALFIGVVYGAHLSRIGTWTARLAGGSLLVLGVAVVVWLRIRETRSFSTPKRAIETVVVRTERVLGERILRALRLVEEPGLTKGQSVELASIHYERLLAQASIDAVGASGKRRGGWLTKAALLGTLLSAVGVGIAPLKVLEGADVFLATDGLAPIDMVWLSHPRLSVNPPSYLRQAPMQIGMDSASVVPDGSELRLVARPLRDRRKLVLSDGHTEVPFADDGKGALVAHWTVEAKNVELFVAARFGDVLIREPRRVQVFAQPDRLPRVRLEGAPAEFELNQMERLELRWGAVDDNSLSQVDLVLRSAGREERRTLERYPSDKTQGSGGYVIYPSDPFFKRIFLPATLRIEARDNDPRGGNKWGRSDALTVKPPTVGSPQVARLSALKSVRDDLVDFLAEQLQLEKIEDRKQRREARATLLPKLKQIEKKTEVTLVASYQGLAVPKGWSAFAAGQLQKLSRAFQLRKNETETLAETVRALDAPLSSLANGDAKEVAKRLGDVAEEAAYGARLAQELEQREQGLERLDIAIAVLDLGAAQLAQLGVLGADLGSVAQGDLARVVRARKTEDLFHAELAALHMAQRLHRPNPSFGAKGGGGGGGVESGNGHSGGERADGAAGDASDADSEFNGVAEDLARLAQEHAGAIERTSGALDSAEDAVRKDDIAEEAKRRATALRRSAERLPQPGERAETGRAAAALAREHVGAMAHELERMALEEALESGRRARAAAEDAQRRGLDGETARQLEGAQRVLSEQRAWAREQLERLNRLTEQVARDALSEVGQVELELSERARRLSSEETADGALPEETRNRLSQAQRLMDDAGRRLQSGQGQVALRLQQEAQRLIEEAETGKTNDDEHEARAQESGSTGKRRGGIGGDVPKPEKENRAEAFRRRVLDGLSKRSGGRLSPAVKRYAEGLLR